MQIWGGSLPSWGPKEPRPGTVTRGTLAKGSPPCGILWHPVASRENPMIGQAGLEVVDGVSVDGHARNWHAGGHPLLKNWGRKPRALVLLHRQILSFQPVGTPATKIVKYIAGCQESFAFRNHSCPSVTSIPDIPVALGISGPLGRQHLPETTTKDPVFAGRFPKSAGAISFLSALDFWGFTFTLSLVKMALCSRCVHHGPSRNQRTKSNRIQKKHVSPISKWKKSWMASYCLGSQNCTGDDDTSSGSCQRWHQTTCSAQCQARIVGWVQNGPHTLINSTEWFILRFKRRSEHYKWPKLYLFGHIWALFCSLKFRAYGRK